MKDQALSHESRRGSALILVVIISFALFTALAYGLKSSVTEMRINSRHTLRQEAKTASESIVEYGFAELISRFTRQTSFPINELSSGNNPLSLPDTFGSFYSDTNIDTGESTLWGGAIPPGEWMYIDPNDPANEFDPLKGKLAFVREIVVLGKAVADNGSFGDPITAYTMQKLQVRDSPLFAHALFYNMDLEVHPGPKMNIYGSVHCNKDAYLQSCDSITFHEGVYAAGEILHGYKQSGSHTQSGRVLVPNVSGNNMDMYIGGSKSSDSAWLDSRNEDFREEASQRWDGNLQAEEHGVPVLNPIGMDDYIPDDPYTANDELMNNAYAIIEPVLPTDHPDYKGDSEQEKMQYNAGLIFSVQGTRNSIPGSGTMEPTSSYTISAYRYERSNPNDPYSDPVIDAGTGLPVQIPVSFPIDLIGDANSSMTAVEDPDGDNIAEPETYYYDGDRTETITYTDWRGRTRTRTVTVNGSNTVQGGMYDHRQDVALDMVSIDIGRLTQYVDDTVNGKSSTEMSNDYWGGTYNPETDWNGVVYVEFPTETDSGGRPDHIVSGSDPNIALQTINAGNIPAPSYALDDGLMLATNAPLYIVGNFNADGNAHANDANMPDNADEPPAGVACDSLTVLSNNWSNNRRYSHVSNTGNRGANYTEVSAAILTGLKPTIPDAAAGGSSSWISGGAHNFPRFLENWGGDTLTIRGSLVALFESEVHNSAMPTNFGHYYSPPNRDWGFNENFRQGNYPPGTPNTRTFRRTEFRDLTPGEFTAEYNNLFSVN